MELRVGLAGLGIHGSRYARHLLAGDVAGAKLTAVSRQDEAAGRAFAREHGLAYVGDPLALATHPAVDVVVAVLPPDLHPNVALACLASGRPVLVEKPLAADVPSAARVASETARTGSLLMMAHTLRFDAVVAELLRRREEIGALRLVSINQRFEPAGRSWIDSPGIGGIILNTAVHGFDLMRHLTGLEPATLIAESRATATEHTPDELFALVRLEPGGVVAVLDNARTTASRSGRIELVGSSGQLWGDHVHRTLHLVRERHVESLGPVPPSPTVPAVLAAFVKSVVEGQEPPVTAADGLATVRMADAAERSAREGRRVQVSPDLGG